MKFFCLFLISVLFSFSGAAEMVGHIFRPNTLGGQSCGNPEFDFSAPNTYNKRVFNGDYVDKDLQYLALLMERDDIYGSLKSVFGKYSLGSTKCTAVLVHPEFLLTAAQCVTNFWREIQPNCSSTYQLVARMGTNDIVRRIDGTNFTDIPIDHYFFHKNYNESSPENGYDIALLHLAIEKSIDPRYTVDNPVQRQICLPTNGANNFNPAKANSRTCVIPGWGMTGWNMVTFKGRYALTYLQEQCDLKDRNIMSNPEMRFCTKQNGNLTGAPCFGDSGAPVFCANSNDSVYRMYGLHSFRNTANNAYRDNSECSGTINFAVHTSLLFYEACLRDFLSTWNDFRLKYECDVQMERHRVFCTVKQWTYFNCSVHVPDYNCRTYNKFQYTVPLSEMSYKKIPDTGCFKGRSAYLCVD